MQSFYGERVTVIEILVNYYLEVGNIIKGNLDSLGRESLYNVSQDEEIDVFVQEIYASKEIMESLVNR